MARTKTSVGAKLSYGKNSKSSRAANTAPPSATTYSGGRDKPASGSGGNPVCPRETPKWQKPITNFFSQGAEKQETGLENGDGASTSSLSSKLDHEKVPLQAKNTVLDESFVLEPLSGEDSHKIKEYYSENGTVAEIEDVESVSERKSMKRDLESSGDDSVNKRLKVN